ncbi:MAG: alpha-ketoglutarate-dependent dioxygenase AlkB [Cyanobacteria bacterium P01_G01_bin.54]
MSAASTHSPQKPPLQLRAGFIADPHTLWLHLQAAVTWDERMRARKTASFGVAYHYSGITYPETAMLPTLLPICQQINQHIGFLPNNCLLNYYPDGNASMGYHSDDLAQLTPGTGVAILSLGTTRDIAFRARSDRAIEHHYPLTQGSLLYMDTPVQTDWLHAIPKEPGAGARISLTFRQIDSI